MPRVKNFNPDTRANVRIGGTDLGAPFVMPNGKVGFVQGDTWDGTVPKVGSGPDWRSPVILVSPTRNPSQGQPIVIERAVKDGAQLWPYPHNNPEFTTVLPCDAITINGRIYLWVMVTLGLGNERWCEIWYSDNNGENWINGTEYTTPGVGSTSVWRTDHFGGKRVMMTWERGRDGWVYAISTGGLARNKNAIMWRVREGDILNKRKWEAWCYRNGQWQWIIDPPDPADILPAGTTCGEMCLRWIQGHWVLSYLELNQGAMAVKVGYGPIEGINWHTTQTKRPIRSGVQAPFLGAERMERFYGCYVHPDSKFDGEFTLIMSEWLLEGGIYNGEGPYRTSQWKMNTKPTAMGTLLADPAPPDAGGGNEGDWAPVLAEFIGN